MAKVILSLDGGGIRGAATTRFLSRLQELLGQQYQTNLRKQVDFFAGTSTGAIIALALANTKLSLRQIDNLYNSTNARRIFLDNRGWFEIDGINAPKYEGSGKTRILRQKLGPETTLGNLATGKHVLVVTYSVNARRPVVIKSTEPRHLDLLSYRIADASSAAPTYFPTVPLRIPPGSNPRRTRKEWLVDGGIVANNPTMCAICESRQAWKDVAMDDLRVLSVGTGTATRPITGGESAKWGITEWFLKGSIIELTMDERIVAYQAKTILAEGHYIRVNADLSDQSNIGLPDPPDDAMDYIDEENIEKLRELGEYWFEMYGQAAADLLTGQYEGPSLDRIDPATGKPRQGRDDFPQECSKPTGNP